MKNEFLFIFIIMLIFIAACRQAPQQDVMEKKDTMEKEAMEKPPTTGDAAVDAVGSDLNNVNNVEKDLSADELSDLDSGLSDIENI